MAYNPQVNYGYSGGAFGSNVAPTPIPKPDLDLAAQIPGLAKANASASGFINNELMGKLSPETLAMIKDSGAAWGIANGMPGSGLSNNRTLRDLGRTVEDTRRQGVQDYNSFIPTVSRTQTVSPETQADINSGNAVNAAAPNPAAAQSYAMQLFNQYLNKINPKQGETSSYFTPAGSNTRMPYSAAFA